MVAPLIFFDLETAGVDPKRHPIIQIAAIATDENLEPLEAFEAKIRFNEQSAHKQALRKNHYHPGTWAQLALSKSEAAQQFAQFLQRHATVRQLSAKGQMYQVAQLVAHNGQFDGPFLQVWYQQLGMFLPARRQVLCTLQRAQWYFAEHPLLTPPRDFKLATLCQYFEVAFHAAAAHDALADVTATWKLYRQLQAAGARAKMAA